MARLGRAARSKVLEEAVEDVGARGAIVELALLASDDPILRSTLRSVSKHQRKAFETYISNTFHVQVFFVGFV